MSLRNTLLILCESLLWAQKIPHHLHMTRVQRSQTAAGKQQPLIVLHPKQGFFGLRFGPGFCSFRFGHAPFYRSRSFV